MKEEVKRMNEKQFVGMTDVLVSVDEHQHITTKSSD